MAHSIRLLSLYSGLSVFFTTAQMEEAIPSLSTGVVGSRFVSQEELDTAKARRQEQWKAAYARYDLRQAASGTHVQSHINGA